MKTIKYDQNGVNVDIKFDDDNKDIWMNQNDMASLFSRTVSLIRKHLKNLDYTDERMRTGEFRSLVDKVNRTYNIKHYNLEVIKQIGYKINPLFTNEFIRWVEDELQRQQSQNIPIESNIIRFEEDGIVLDVRVIPNEETVWLTQKDMAILFDISLPTINEHISNILKDNELESDSVFRKNLITAHDGKNYEVNLYNLDMIISVGYRVNSRRGIIFRRWATKVIKNYSLRGYAFNENRIRIIESNFIELKEEVNTTKERIKSIEEKINISYKNEIIFYEGKVFDGYDFLCSVINQANKSIVIIDPYVDEITLSILKNKKKGVKVSIISTNKMNISDIDLEVFNQQYGQVHIIKKNTFHDRFIINDDKDIYHLGSSINRIGHHISAVIRMEDLEFIKYVEKTLTDIK